MQLCLNSIEILGGTDNAKAPVAKSQWYMESNFSQSTHSNGNYEEHQRTKETGQEIDDQRYSENTK